MNDLSQHKADLAYDGTGFLGWQIQKEGRTVQGDLHAALERIHGHPVKVNAAGRTDSGVHATGQVVNFPSDLDTIPQERFCDAVNAYLPQDVRAMESSEVPATFHARRSAVKRLYQYRFILRRIPYPHERLYCLKLKGNPAIHRLNRLASVFIGSHDFTTFAAAGDVNPIKIRRVSTSCFFQQGEYLIYRIAADSFLRKMVRSVVGTILESEKEGLSTQDLRKKLDAMDRCQAGQTAPAKGLFLTRVYYRHE